MCLGHWEVLIDENTGFFQGFLFFPGLSVAKYLVKVQMWL